MTNFQTQRSWPWLARSGAVLHMSYWWVGLWDGSMGGKTTPLDWKFLCEVLINGIYGATENQTQRSWPSLSNVSCCGPNQPFIGNLTCIWDLLRARQLRWITKIYGRCLYKVSMMWPKFRPSGVGLGSPMCHVVLKMRCILRMWHVWGICWGKDNSAGLEICIWGPHIRYLWCDQFSDPAELALVVPFVLYSSNKQRIWGVRENCRGQDNSAGLEFFMWGPHKRYLWCDQFADPAELALVVHFVL